MRHEETLKPSVMYTWVSTPLIYKHVFFFCSGKFTSSQFIFHDLNGVSIIYMYENNIFYCVGKNQRKIAVEGKTTLREWSTFDLGLLSSTVTIAFVFVPC